MTDIAAHPELGAEQQHIDRCYLALDAAVAPRTQPVSAADGKSADRIQGILNDHREQLLHVRNSGEPLVFGRIDYAPDADHPCAGDRLYVGLVALDDDHRDELLVRWEADAAKPFFQATAVEGGPLERRRSFECEGPRLQSIQDFVYPPAHIDAAEPGLEDPLLRALERAASGEMRHIVATIQADQDRLMRSATEGVLVVQGGPGTGKTAVGLHRIAVILYREAARMSERDVLVIGPNDVHLGYISNVLPSLGRSAVAHLSMDALGSGPGVRIDDPLEVRQIKGSAGMPDLLRRFLDGRITPLQADARFGQGLRLRAETANEIVDRHRHAPGSYLLRRETVRRDWISAIAGDALGRNLVQQTLNRDKAFQQALERVWPTMSASEGIRTLLEGPRVMARAAEELLDADEVALLRKPRTQRVTDVQWSAEDRLLIEELQVMLDGSMPESYAHIVVDEAQDLSPMQWRAVGRRAPSGSMTVLGDLVQATTPWAPTSWTEHMPEGLVRQAELTELTLGYRVPSQAMDYANQLLPAIGVDVEPPRSVRIGEDDPAVMGSDDRGRLLLELRDVVSILLRDAEPGHIGVIVAPSDVGEVRQALVQETADVGYAPDDGLTRKVTVVPADVTQGLEFEHVFVVEPASIARLPQGLRLLYIALTRCRQSLTVLHVEPLPTALTGEVHEPEVPAEPVSAEPSPESEEPALPEVPPAVAPATTSQAVPPISYREVDGRLFRIERQPGQSGPEVAAVEVVTTDGSPPTGRVIVLDDTGTPSQAMWRDGSGAPRHATGASVEELLDLILPTL